MNDFDPSATMIVLFVVILSWWVVGYYYRSWKRKIRRDTPPITDWCARIGEQQRRFHLEARKKNNPPEEPPGTAPVPVGGPKKPVLSGSAAKKFPPKEDE